MTTSAGPRIAASPTSTASAPAPRDRRPSSGAFLLPLLTKERLGLFGQLGHFVLDDGPADAGVQVSVAADYPVAEAHKCLLSRCIDGFLLLLYAPAQVGVADRPDLHEVHAPPKQPFKVVQEPEVSLGVPLRAHGRELYGVV